MLEISFLIQGFKFFLELIHLVYFYCRHFGYDKRHRFGHKEQNDVRFHKNVHIGSQTDNAVRHDVRLIPNGNQLDVGRVIVFSLPPNLIISCLDTVNYCLMENQC